MHNIICSTPAILALILCSYLVGIYIYKTTKFSLLQPVLVSIIIIIPILEWLDIEYETFKKGSEMIDFMLGPSVVAIGYLLYNHLEHIKGKVLPILTSIIVGSIVGVASVVVICKLMGCDTIIISSLSSKSVTTPIALSISERSGGILSLTAISVIISGILGGIIGPAVLDRFKIKSKTARGLAMGAAAHGLGTARALELGTIEGALSGLAIGLMGIATSLIIPLFELIQKI